MYNPNEREKNWWKGKNQMARVERKKKLIMCRQNRFTNFDQTKKRSPRFLVNHEQSGETETVR